MAKHARGRARIFFSDAAAKQIEAITDEAEIHALDRALPLCPSSPTSAARSPAPTPSCASTPTTSTTSASSTT